MAFPVKYVNPRESGEILHFSGKGAVHLLETGIVLEGVFPLFRMPFVISDRLELLGRYTIRTVPYSVIVKYRQPTLLRKNHLLAFNMPICGPKTEYVVAFELERTTTNDEFSSRILDSMRIAKGLSSRT